MRKASRLGLAWKEGILGVLGRFLFPAEQSWEKGQPRPCQSQPHSSWVPQTRQSPNVSSCWAGKMIPNNSPINRLRRGDVEQDGPWWPPSSGRAAEHVLNVMHCPREGKGQNNLPLCCKEAASSRVGSQELPELGEWEESLTRGLDQHKLCWRGCRVLPMLCSPGGPHPAFAGRRLGTDASSPYSTSSRKAQARSWCRYLSSHSLPEKALIFFLAGFY